MISAAVLHAIAVVHLHRRELLGGLIHEYDACGMH